MTRAHSATRLTGQCGLVGRAKGQEKTVDTAPTPISASGAYEEEEEEETFGPVGCVSSSRPASLRWAPCFLGDGVKTVARNDHGERVVAF